MKLANAASENMIIILPFSMFYKNKRNVFLYCGRMLFPSPEMGGAFGGRVTD